MAAGGDVLQPVCANASPSASAKAGKVRILWRGALVLPDGVPLPGLAIVSTHLPAAPAARSPRTRIRTSDVFGTPITPVEEAVDALDLDGQRREDESESDLTLAIEVLRHAPLSVRTCERGGASSAGAGSEMDLERWTVSSSTSLSLDSAHWSTIDYLQRTLLPPTDPPRVTLTIAPPLQEPISSGTALKGGKRLLPPAAPFDVFSEPSNEFAIVPILMPVEKATTTKRGKGSTQTAQPVRLALAQRKRVAGPFALPNPLLGGAGGTATASGTETGLSATKKRMAAAARRNAKAHAASTGAEHAGVVAPIPLAGAPLTARVRTATATITSVDTQMTQAAADVGPAQLGPPFPGAAGRGQPSAIPRTQVRQQIKRLARYALLARGMVEPSSSSKQGASQGTQGNAGKVGGPALGSGTAGTPAAADEYGPCLRAVVAATEAALKPELDALALASSTLPSTAPDPLGITTATAALPIDLPRLAAFVQAYVQMYAPPLPRAMLAPGLGPGPGPAPPASAGAGPGG